MICLPLILVAFIIVFEFSQLFWAHHVAANNVRSAIRYLSRAPLVEPFLTQTENMAKTGRINDAIGAYDWMVNIVVDLQPSFDSFTSADFRENGQVIRIQADIPYSFMTFNMLNSFTNGSAESDIVFSIVEEARYIGE
ncbi:MAG: hypothetical protein COA45_03110 [Zetaproteobacteria bacterium]|nr:MAG: hypothetical protein COA45_03110 [Zetaproteobacteria bacterium]